MDENDRASKLTSSELKKWLVIRRCSTDDGPGLQASPVPKQPLPDSGSNAVGLEKSKETDET